MLRRLGCVSFFALALLVPKLTWAAQPGASIVGTVSDETGGVLPGVTVDLHAGAAELLAVTDGVGHYRFDRVPPGAVTLTFKLINFRWPFTFCLIVHFGSIINVGHNRPRF